jgi:hypothetical protein
LIVVEIQEFAILDHQPTAMAPQEIHERAMRIRSLVGMLVVEAMHGDPTRWCVLQVTHAQDGKAMFQPFWGNETLMRQQAVVTQVDAQRTEHIESE